MMPQAPWPRKQGGFSLLEAIVALTLMATCLLALYAWLSSSTLALNHVSAKALSLQDSRAALAVIDTINPMATPTGVRNLDPLEIRWKASPMTDQRVGMTEAYSASPFDFRLFLLTVTVSRGKHVVNEFDVRKTGWVVTRPIRLDDNY
ncbi:MAG: prepilin-type N-terminal cleavage/methylation domain-containing protein [Rhodanobacter sp.]